MSGLFKPTPGGAGIDGTVADPVGPGGIIVDPLIEITQPGGPFPVGHAILADGLGGYTLAATLRPYLLGFTIPTQVPMSGTVECEHQGISTTLVGPVVPMATNLIGISVSVEAAVAAATSYTIEIVSDPTGAPSVLGSLVLDTAEGRSAFRRDLSVAITAGTEIGARITQTAGAAGSLFTVGVITIELET